MKITAVNEKLFRDVYRNFKRKNLKCDSIDMLRSVLDSEVGSGNYSVNPAEIFQMDGLKGFCLCYQNVKAFIPQTVTLRKKRTVVEAIGKVFSEAEIILPNYFSMGELETYSAMIKEADSKEKKIAAGDQVLAAMYPHELLSRLVTVHYPQFNALRDSHQQIKETTEAYCFGFNRSAITTLLPCIENAIRALGDTLNVKNEGKFSVRYLLSVYEEWLTFYINGFIFKDYDWKPADLTSRKLFSDSDVRYQIALSGMHYIENHLYKDSRTDDGISLLNRHSILHGFMPEYHKRANYLRLINLLNNLCFMLTLSGDPVSLSLPNETGSSQRFNHNLGFLKKWGLVRAAYLAEHSLD